MKNIILTLLITWPLALAAQTPTLVRTFPNPTPNTADFFGSAMAALGNDRILVGAPSDDTVDPEFYGIGAAYLYSTNGTLLMTFKNPDPSQTIAWGFSMAAFGNGRVGGTGWIERHTGQ